ncbi:MAG TPA: GYD domain-containing protein [Vicinamibacterales bacterium]|nr:GYD domain-containing protein [Vicinamibacterales bacterium]
MAKFLVTVSYTAEGAKGVRKDGGTKREHAAREAVESLGGKIEAFYFSFGHYDAVVIADFPSASAAAALSLAVAASGGAHCRTTPLLTSAEMDHAASTKTAYRAPGQ